MTILAAFTFGCCIGSFLNVLIWRLPREESTGGRSHCPQCNHTLVWYDLVPLVSYLAGRGRCRYCKASVSYRYPLIETVTGLLFAIAAYGFMVTTSSSALTLIWVAIAISVCVTVFVIDLEHYLILNKVVYVVSACMLVILAIESISKGTFMPLLTGILSGAAASILFWSIWYFSDGKWMGLGDAKFVALMGLMLGWPGTLVALFLAFMLGALVGIILMALGKKHMNSKLPFGTFLSLATLIAVLWGTRLWDAYWSLVNIY